MPQLAQRVDQDKKANGGIPQDLRQLLALNDMTQAGNNAGIQAALNQPQNPPTVAQSIQQRAQQALQARMTQEAMKNSQGAIPAGIPRPQMQGIDQLDSNVGESYRGGGIISFAEGEEVPERDILRRMEAAAYDQTNPTPAPVPQSAEDIVYQAMRLNPDIERAKTEARRNAIQRDTSAMDELKAELLAQRDRLKGPQSNWEKGMEWLEQIATAPRGVGSFAAAAMGAQKQKELENARRAQQHDLTKQMLDVAQKKADIGYQHKLDVYGAGESAEAAAIKERYAAAINRENNTLEKQKLAQQMDLELQKLAVHKQQVAAMNRPPAFQQIYSELQRLNPTADKAKLLDQAVSMAGLSSKQDSADAQIIGKLNDEMKQIDAAEKELRFVELTNPEKYKTSKAALDVRRKNTENMLSQMYSRIGGTQGLPDLAKTGTTTPTPTASPKVKFLGFE
jgi:hypothetical protein